MGELDAVSFYFGQAPRVINPPPLAWTDAGNRSESHPRHFLQAYSGTIVADTYSDHEGLHQEATSVLDQLHHIVQQLSKHTTPKHPLGVACTYFLNRWPRLHRCLSDGRFPIDSNALERLWKPVALGRKNYLFVNNEAGGQRAACAYSVTLSCRLNHIDPYHYLCEVFDELHHGTKSPSA